MKLLYITYIDFGNLSSGSNVRPQKMYDAFKTCGHQVKLVSTQQNRYWKRTIAALDAIRWVMHNDFDACYVESPSGPIFNPLDIKLLKIIAKRGKAISYFFRDAYWLTGNEAVSYSNIGKLKYRIIALLHERDIRVLKKVAKIVYMPSETFINDFFKYHTFDNVKPLPPGTDPCECGYNEYKETKTGIYVGGAVPAYGVDILIDAYRKLNKDRNGYNLIVITRKGELPDEEELSKECSWLRIEHKSGEELKPYYGMADVAMLPSRKSHYLDSSFSVKMFGYLSNGLPIIVNDLYEMKRFILNNKVGYSYDQTSDSLAECILDYYNNGEQEELRNNVIKTCNENTWVSRAKEVINDFTQIQNGVI